MSISRNNCPVPFDQQPLNEYLALKQLWPFSWSTYKMKDYSLAIISFSSFLFIFLGFMLLLVFINKMNLYKILILNCLVVDLILLILFIRIYLGWSYIVKRLLSATIFYEESGWYDGQVWVKTAASLTQDRLVGLYQIVPYIKRIRWTCLIFCLIFSFDYCLYQVF